MSESNKALAAIGYIPLLFWIPLFLSGGDDFAKYHGRQAFVIFIGWLLVLLVFAFLRWITLWFKPLWILFTFTEGVLVLALILVSIFAIIKAARGERWRVPVLGAYSDRLNL